MFQDTVCVMWKRHTSDGHSAAQRSEEHLHRYSQQHNKCTQVCSVTLATVTEETVCLGFLSYLLKHTQVRQHSLTVILLIHICSICLASQRWDLEN